MHAVSVEQGELITTPNGSQARVGNLSHAAIVNDETGEESVQWCRGNSTLDEAGAAVTNVGFGTVVFDNGDLLWISFIGNAQQGKNSFTVIGGTGEYEGATGGGTNQTVSQRGDGRSWTSKAEGKITTP